MYHQFSIRTAGDPYAVVPEVHRAARETLKDVPVERITTLADQVDAALVPERLIVTLTQFFGALGGVLAGIGLYGLLAYAVARRVNEIGIRMALGATAADVRLLVVRDAMASTAGGILAGAVLVLWDPPARRRRLRRPEARQPRPLIIGATAILTIALLASYIPVRRAARVDPMVALRHE